MFPSKRSLLRYEDYLPLHGQGQYPSWKPSYQLLALILLASVLVVTSFVCNVITIVHDIHRATRPLDDYQNL